MTTPVQSHQEAIRSVAKLHRILEASKLLNSTLDLAELTTIILRIVRDEVGTDRGTVFVLDRAHQLLHSLVGQGLEGKQIVLPVGKGIAGAVAATGETIDIPNAYGDARFDPSFDTSLGYRTNDSSCMPIGHPPGTLISLLELITPNRPMPHQAEEFLR